MESELTKTLQCEGGSDDTFGVYGAGPHDDFDNCASGDPIVFRVRSESDGGAMLVIGQYGVGPSGGWLIGVAPDDTEDDETPIPNWPMRFERSARDYSPRLVIEAPADVTVHHVER